MKTPLHTAASIVAALLLCAAFAQNSRATDATVHVGPGGSTTFSPPTVSISVNDSVTWQWDSTFHSSTSGSPGSPDGLWDSTIIFSTPHSFTHQFTTPGTYPYYCQYHYSPPYNMTGEVVVSGAVAPTPPTLAITNPANGTVLAALANVTIQAGVTNGSGAVTNVQFLVNNNLLASQNSGPYSTATNNLTAGSYTLSAVAKDNNGLSATNNITISVVNPVAVSLLNSSHPSDNAFHFSYSADIGLTYIVKRSTDLTTWTPLTTNKAASNPVTFDDPNATNNPGYYRVDRLPNP